ncbi:MAG: tetratricopeptide repeat protein [Desulfobaccales bacterium]
MRYAHVIRYLAVVVSLLLLAACGTLPGMRTSMPPTPPETPPGTEAAAPGQAPAQAPAPDLAQQVLNLQARVEQLEGRVAQMESRPGAAGAGKPSSLTPSTAVYPKPTAKPAVSGAAAEKYYTEGMRLYHAKKLGEARNQFHQYLKNQPKGPKAAEARYYLADSFYQENKYQEAAVEFNKLRLQHPQSILAPAGLLRQALCYKSQQQMATYRSTLQKLVKAYPNSPEAKEAQKMLKEGQKPATPATPSGKQQKN